MKTILILVLILLVWQCRSPHSTNTSEPVYIYDSNNILKFQILKDDLVKDPSDSQIVLLRFRTSKNIPKFVDSFLVSNNRKIYYLDHFLNYDGYADTSFIKHKSYLDCINLDKGFWLESEEKLDSFWLPVNCWRCSGIYDTLQIFLILPKENTDSFIFRQVHRTFYQTQ